jgi:hypothetical protein
MTTSNLVSLDQFSVIKLSGQDATSFLQGQVTCDTNKFTDTNALPGCHCNAKGKMWSAFISIKRNDNIYLVLTKESAQVSLAELNKYGVFAKADIEDDSANWHIYGSDNGVEGCENIELSENHFMILSSTQLEASEDSRKWWQTELLTGRAHLYAATSGEYLPQMLNLQAFNYISFNKGCYMGQEMVARMRYLGKNKRALFIASTEHTLGLTIGQDVYVELNGNRRSAGKVINSVTTEEGTVAQLVLAKDTELSTTIYTSAESEQFLKLSPLPYTLEDN